MRSRALYCYGIALQGWERQWKSMSRHGHAKDKQSGGLLSSAMVKHCGAYLRIALMRLGEQRNRRGRYGVDGRRGSVGTRRKGIGQLCFGIATRSFAADEKSGEL